MVTKYSLRKYTNYFRKTQYPIPKSIDTHLFCLNGVVLLKVYIQELLGGDK